MNGLPVPFLLLSKSLRIRNEAIFLTKFIYYNRKLIKDNKSLSGCENMAKRTKTKTKKIAKKNYVLRGKNGKETGVFSGNQPRQAALKAANRSKGTKSNPVEIRLRERGSKKIHIFKGWKEIVTAPKNKPAWMPDKINKPNVEKVGIEKLKKI